MGMDNWLYSNNLSAGMMKPNPSFKERLINSRIVHVRLSVFIRIRSIYQMLSEQSLRRLNKKNTSLK